MRSMNDWPGSWVISTTMRSESTRVPPVTALRSPPASRMTGADSPVMADSSTDAMPSMTVPSPGITWPASTTTTSPRVSAEAGLLEPSRSVATVSERIARSASACALPRPSAIASAKLPNTTVSHRKNATTNVNHAGSPPPPGASPPNNWTSQISVVRIAPTSTTNITGLRMTWRGSSLASDDSDRGQQDVALQQRALGAVGHRDVSRSRARFSSSTLTEPAPPSPNSGLLVWSSTSSSTRARESPRRSATRCDWMRALASEMSGSTPEAEVVTASGGTWLARRLRSNRRSRCR